MHRDSGCWSEDWYNSLPSKNSHQQTVSSYRHPVRVVGGFRLQPKSCPYFMLQTLTSSLTSWATLNSTTMHWIISIWCQSTTNGKMWRLIIMTLILMIGGQAVVASPTVNIPSSWVLLRKRPSCRRIQNIRWFWMQGYVCHIPFSTWIIGGKECVMDGTFSSSNSCSEKRWTILQASFFCIPLNPLFSSFRPSRTKILFRSHSRITPYPPSYT